MKLLVIILVLAATSWLFASCYRPLFSFSVWWKLCFGISSLIGILCGFVLVAWTRNETPTLKLTGYPFTIAAAEFIDGRWLGGLIAQYHLFAMLGDLSVGLFLFLSPFRFAQWMASRLWRRNAIA